MGKLINRARLDKDSGGMEPNRSVLSQGFKSGNA